MQTPLTVECGDGLTVKLTMHEEILCCHSKLLADRFANAKSLREQYKRTKSISDKIAACVFPEVSPKQFEDSGLEVRVRSAVMREPLSDQGPSFTKVLIEPQVIPLILLAYEDWPLQGYLNAVKKAVDEAVQEQVANKNIKNTTLKDLARITDLPTRLSHLKSRGVQTVAERLFVKLHQINKKEEKRALDEEIRAAAQHRLLLPGVDEKIVRSLMQWIYQGTLHYHDVEQLYAMLQLSHVFGIEALTEICLAKLYNAANDSIQCASDTGVGLQALLGYGPDSVDSVFGVIFKHVLQDKFAPRRLHDLVLDTLAAGLDTELWKELKGQLNLEMALEIIEAMLEHGQQIKSELDNHDHIKSESLQGSAELSTPSSDNQSL